MQENFDVVVVGAGFAGMYAIHRFRKLGLTIKVLEAGSDVGGTWYWNRYPGARCDVASLEYSFGFSKELEQEWEWPEVFSSQPDILRYANHVADRFELRRDIQFNTRVVEMKYVESSNLWQIKSENGELFQSRFCVMATGCLSVPNTPLLSGADNFEGEILHTGRWPKEPVNLSGKRVGIIGTGSSGVQAIPELAKQSEHLTVFQRTPVYTVPANRKKMNPAVQQEFRDHYEHIRALQQNSRAGVSGYRPGKNAHAAVGAVGADQSNQIRELSHSERKAMIDQYGLGILLSFGDVSSDLEANEIANELFREAIEEMIDDPNVARKLMPKNYGLGCKRQVLDRDYYATFNRPDVTLVDLIETPLQHIQSAGIQTMDDFYPLDVLIYATGFDAMTGALMRSNIVGRSGRKLKHKWSDGPVAYLGLQMHGFPNLFTVTGPGSPSVLCNMLVAIEQHVDWIADCIAYIRDNKLETIEPTVEAESRWVEHVNEVSVGTMFRAPTCNSWYLGANIEGKPRIFMPYVGGYERYRKQCERIASEGYDGFMLA